MIIDLLRNDLSRVCTPESVHVPSLCNLESYASLHHLVSVVTGELAHGEDAVGLLRACFPGAAQLPELPRYARWKLSWISSVWRERCIAGP
ncbi:isochorismate synthase EntC [Bradyrhizobium sp. GM6.1]